MKPTPIEPTMIGALVTCLRMDEGLTMTEFAERVGVSVSTVSMWESGQRTPALKTFFDIIKVCNKQIYYVNQ